jgi:hypothetical protein
MCDHVTTTGGIPGCCYYCPTGASLYGSVEDLLEEAHKRIAMTEGSKYDFQVKSLNSGETAQREVKKYVNYVYGEKESGGTQYMIISAVPFHELGLPNLPEKSAASKSENLQHSIYKGLIAPGALLAGLLFAAYRGNRSHNETEERR